MLYFFVILAPAAPPAVAFPPVAFPPVALPPAPPALALPPAPPAGAPPGGGVCAFAMLNSNEATVTTAVSKTAAAIANMICLYIAMLTTKNYLWVSNCLGVARRNNRRTMMAVFDMPDIASWLVK